MVVLVKKIGSRRMCNARCYNAKGEHCACICGSINHGIGYDAAIANMDKAAQALIEKIPSDGGVQVKLPVVKEVIAIEVH